MTESKGEKCGEPECCYLKSIVKGVVARTRYILATSRNVVAEGKNPEVKVFAASAYSARTDSVKIQEILTRSNVGFPIQVQEGILLPKQ